MNKTEFIAQTFSNLLSASISRHGWPDITTDEKGEKVMDFGFEDHLWLAETAASFLEQKNQAPWTPSDG